jgi:hypothetical protein
LGRKIYTVPGVELNHCQADFQSTTRNVPFDSKDRILWDLQIVQSKLLASFNLCGSARFNCGPWNFHEGEIVACGGAIERL